MALAEAAWKRDTVRTERAGKPKDFTLWNTHLEIASPKASPAHHKLVSTKRKHTPRATNTTVDRDICTSDTIAQAARAASVSCTPGDRYGPVLSFTAIVFNYTVTGTTI